MSESPQETKPVQASELPPPPAPLSPLALCFRLCVIALVLGVALWATFWMLGSKPKSKPRPQARTAPLVEVRQAAFTPRQIRVPASGTVIPARDLELRPEVSGTVAELSGAFVPGAELRKGEVLLRIDDREYRLAVARSLAALEQIRSELLLEQGNQIVARGEFELLGEAVSEKERDLMLRLPQLRSLEARLKAAEADLAQAELDLERTAVRVPFNAVVVEKRVELGSRVNESTALARLAGTDAFWAEVSVPLHLLDFIEIPGAPARIRPYRNGIAHQGREGRVIRRLPALEEQGRMARLLVEVRDPLSLARKAEPLLLGSYVQLEIEGRPLAAALELPRNLLREGDRLWVLSPGGTLDIREVEVAFRDREHVLITGGIEAGERLILTELPAPVQGMPLRSEDEAVAAAGKEKS